MGAHGVDHHLADRDIIDTIFLKGIDWHEVWEELNEVSDVLAEAELVAFIETLEEEVAFFGDQGHVFMSGEDSLNLMKNKIVLDKSWHSLVNLLVAVTSTVLLKEVQGELDARIYAHSPPPNINLESVTESCHIQAAASYVNDLHFLLSIVQIFEFDRILWIGMDLI